MIVRAALKTDRESIRKLWHDCFQDPYEYIDFYLENRFKPETCVLLEENEEVIGMVHLLPCKIFPNQKAFYWYAAGIKSTKRNKGLFRVFTEFLIKQIKIRGYCNVCVPAPGLENFYRSIGFVYPYFVSDEVFVNGDDSKHALVNNESKPVIFSSAEPKDFLENPRMGDSFWDEEAIAYAVKENVYCGGKALKYKNANKEFVFFAIKKDDGFLIDYHNLTRKEFVEIKEWLFNELQCNRLIFRTTGEEKTLGLSDSQLVGQNSKITMTLA